MHPEDGRHYRETLRCLVANALMELDRPSDDESVWKLIKIFEKNGVDVSVIPDDKPIYALDAHPCGEVMGTESTFCILGTEPNAG